MRIFIGENSIRFNSTGSSIGVQRERERGANSYLANSGWYREEMDREKSIAPTLLHTELLFVVSSYRGSINAGPRIDPPRFRFRRLFVRSLRLPFTPSPPRMDSPRWSYPVNRPSPLESIRWIRDSTLCRRTAGRIAGDLWRFTSRMNEPGTKKIERAISMIALWTVTKLASKSFVVFSDYIFRDVFLFFFLERANVCFVQHPLNGVGFNGKMYRLTNIGIFFRNRRFSPFWNIVLHPETENLYQWKNCSKRVTRLF